ncbi:hypothetical protein Pmani_011867 [Petrolisthes manimaculis]|uniref:Uncharacterized protein n=1 Tax=Petrolisthes manimaculis TaxID=1843537 RepID=A0AAE1PYF1_9EUCA|nr:hypothetical protein Pmani_011867 [Petrolisthes manimaculis]
MVATYDVGKPVRSYVLIPGTGSNKEAKPLCLDLASTSSVAGVVPVPPTIPQSVPVGNLTPSKEKDETKEKKDDMKKEEDVKTGSNHGRPSVALPIPPEPASQSGATGGGIKRSLSEEATNEECKGDVPRMTKIMKGEVTQIVKEVIAAPRPEVEELQKKCTKLEERNKNLEERNKNLERRLVMFHDLFRSKERIISFVKFLESTS